ncbi:hypothetical protein LRU_01118 [Ligilactobacillus ruminis SPM0211]|uniref:Uncharacterized protein n=1 Tax=Ligilactobacillus ruminis SPM0211 TaxID=1040964 RepID=F7R0M8_9LACO|nr:hypothetical protein LRU_01118 [Ligilactobacillus ruminis SPM0211]
MLQKAAGKTLSQIEKNGWFATDCKFDRFLRMHDNRLP